MTPVPTLLDRAQRPIRSLRLSVIDRCNLRCEYCMPADGLKFARTAELLTFDDILFTLGVATELGIHRVRVTGGEPLLRPDLPGLIAKIRGETAVTDLSLTTNALLLHRHARALRDAGLTRVNISLDSLRPDRFSSVTRNGHLRDVWRGIEAAAEAGLGPLRINAVVLNGFNDDEVEEWLALTRTRDITVRFLELMPIGEGASLGRLGRFANLTALRAGLVERHGLVPATDASGNGPAKYWRAPGAPGRLGFITPLSEKYCRDCTRFRLTSTGEVRPCLAFDVQVALRDAIRARDARAVRDGFVEAARIKPDGHHWDVDQVTHTGMSRLGG
jgi:cyclic pyranopterin phosphate synthase